MTLGASNRNLKTQRGRVLALLIAALAGWVPAYELAEVGGLQWQVRIVELRRMGFNIVNRTERKGRQVRSWYRLIPSKPAPVTAPAPKHPVRADSPTPAEPTLFDLSPKDRSYME